MNALLFFVSSALLVRTQAGNTISHPCKTDADCSDENYCSATTGVCARLHCTTDADCSDEDYCGATTGVCTGRYARRTTATCRLDLEQYPWCTSEVPHTFSRPLPKEVEASGPFKAGAVLPWKKDALDSTATTACLQGITTNGTQRFVVGEGGVVLAGEVGEELRTLLDAGFPQYYYGVLVEGNELLVTGFDLTVPVSQGNGDGIARSSFDGGATWSKTQLVSKGVWLGGPIAATKSGSVLVPPINDAPVFVRDKKTGSWAKVAAGDPAYYWHAGPFVVDGDDVVLTGMNLCKSNDSASSFSCGNPVDDVFDGGIAVVSGKASSPTSTWITGGGAISPDLVGWTHHSTNGGKSWDKRHAFPYPIRHVGAACGATIAVGGDFSSGVGGIWASQDGGATWALDLDTGVEMSACATEAGYVTCVGSAQGKSSVVVTAKC